MNPANILAAAGAAGHIGRMDANAPAPPDSEQAQPEGPALDHVETWLFDLDNTLYPASCNLFAQIDERMGAFISDFLGVDRVEARLVQKSYFREYGTTMRGLMMEHGLDPDIFLDYVHEIDHSPVPRDHALDAVLGRLEGPKHVFTNASTRHAEKVIARLGIGHHFESIFDIAAADYLPKPHPDTYDRLVRVAGLTPESCALVDDIPKNLEPAAALGMTTIWMRTESEYAEIGDRNGAYVHHVADELAGWLDSVVRARARAGR